MPVWFWTNLRVQVFSPRTVQESAGVCPSACTERESQGERRRGCAEGFESIWGVFHLVVIDDQLDTEQS